MTEGVPVPGGETGARAVTVVGEKREEEGDIYHDPKELEELMKKNSEILQSRKHNWKFFRMRNRKTPVGTWRMGAFDFPMTVRVGSSPLETITEGRPRTKATAKLNIKKSLKRKSAVTLPKSKRQRMLKTPLKQQKYKEECPELSWDDVRDLLLPRPVTEGHHHHHHGVRVESEIKRAHYCDGHRLNYYPEMGRATARIISSVVDLSKMCLHRGRDELDRLSNGGINQPNSQKHSLALSSTIEGNRVWPQANMKLTQSDLWRYHGKLMKLTQTSPYVSFKTVGRGTLTWDYYDWACLTPGWSRIKVKGGLATIVEEKQCTIAQSPSITSIHSLPSTSSPPSLLSPSSLQNALGRPSPPSPSTLRNTASLPSPPSITSLTDESSMSIDLLEENEALMDFDSEYCTANNTGLTQEMFAIGLQENTGLSQGMFCLGLGPTQDIQNLELNLGTGLTQDVHELEISDKSTNTEEINTQQLVTLLTEMATENNEDVDFGINSQNFEEWSQMFEEWDILSAMLNELDTSFIENVQNTQNNQTKVGCEVEVGSGENPGLGVEQGSDKNDESFNNNSITAMELSEVGQESGEWWGLGVEQEVAHVHEPTTTAFLCLANMANLIDPTNTGVGPETDEVNDNDINMNSQIGCKLN